MKYGKLVNNEIEYFESDVNGIITDEYTIINPTDDDYINNGWFPIININEDGQDSIVNNELHHYLGSELTQAKNRKLKEVDRYDVSSEVNGFNLMGMTLWIPRETRVSLQNSTQILLKNGIETTTLWEGTMHFDLPCQLLLQLLDALEIYALQCFNKTAEHKANIIKLTSIEEIESYDYTTGYPEKLTFNL